VSLFRDHGHEWVNYPESIPLLQIFVKFTDCTLAYILVTELAVWVAVLSATSRKR